MIYKKIHFFTNEKTQQNDQGHPGSSQEKWREDVRNRGPRTHAHLAPFHGRTKDQNLRESTPQRNFVNFIFANAFESRFNAKLTLIINLTQINDVHYGLLIFRNKIKSQMIIE